MNMLVKIVNDSPKGSLVILVGTKPYPAVSQAAPVLINESSSSQAPRLRAIKR
jgi:uncharacterized protein YabE (DUF348 family)